MSKSVATTTMKLQRLRLMSCLALALGAMVGRTEAELLTFGRITNNAPENVEGQLFVNVTDPGGSQVAFAFTNNVGTASSITDVYFDDGSLSGIASIIGTSGVSFSQRATPPKLPAANQASPRFVTTFSADSDPPISRNGVNAASESLTITFTLQDVQTFSDVIGELTSGALRVGMHVQAIGVNDESDSFVNNPIPEPSSLGIFGIGSLTAALLWRRRKQTSS